MIDRETLRFASDKPYPPVEVTCQNCTYAKWMLDNLGGSHSEMSTISLYFYNNLMTNEKYGDVAYIFHKTSIVEMHHLSIFGQLALLLGESPRLWTCNRRRKMYWTPGYNHYSTTLEDLLTTALNGERAAVEKYEKQICMIDDPCISDNLKRIVLDEKIHVELIEMMMKEYL